MLGSYQLPYPLSQTPSPASILPPLHTRHQYYRIRLQPPTHTLGTTVYFISQNICGPLCITETQALGTETQPLRSAPQNKTGINPSRRGMKRLFRSFRDLFFPELPRSRRTYTAQISKVILEWLIVRVGLSLDVEDLPLAAGVRLWHRVDGGIEGSVDILLAHHSLALLRVCVLVERLPEHLDINTNVTY
jgi:hypothetical protein